VTAEDVQRAANKYLNLDTVRSVAVGDAVKIKPVLEKCKTGLPACLR
jgi:hypothetical protein